MGAATMLGISGWSRTSSRLGDKSKRWRYVTVPGKSSPATSCSLSGSLNPQATFLPSGRHSRAEAVTDLEALGSGRPPLLQKLEGLGRAQLPARLPSNCAAASSSRSAPR